MNIRISVERVAIGGSIVVSGWVFNDASPVTFLSVYTNSGELAYGSCILGVERQDVFNEFSTAQSLYSGFRVIALVDTTESIGLRVDCADGTSHRLEIAAAGSLQWSKGAGLSDDALFEVGINTPGGWTYARAHSAESPKSKLFPEIIKGMRGPSYLDFSPSSIVVPVYGGKQHLDRFFSSLLSHTGGHHEIIVVDDGNVDPSIKAYLVALASSHENLIVVSCHENRGFVVSANLGIKIAGERNPGRNIALLNSDIEVPPDWIERIQYTLFSDASIASATPFTNSGSIASFPRPTSDNNIFALGDTISVDKIFRDFTFFGPITIPTGIGFCMGISWNALEKVGSFDEKAFGRGYGEEVDWSRRAITAGFRHVLIPYLFVSHFHGGSFQTEERKRLIENAQEKLDEMYPDYHPEVQDFIKFNPTEIVRTAALFKIAKKAQEVSPLVVVLHHGGGGGASSALERTLSKWHESVPILVVEPSRIWNLQPEDIRVGAGPAVLQACLRYQGAEVKFELGDFYELGELCSEFVQGNLVVNSLVGLAEIYGCFEFVSRLQSRGWDIDIYHHDFFALCPSVNLLDHLGNYCGVPDLKYCNECAPRNKYFRVGSRAGFDMVSYRDQWNKITRSASRNIFFSSSSRQIAERGIQIDNAVTLPHLTSSAGRSIRAPQRRKPVLNVAVIGALNDAKGAGIIEKLSNHIDSEDLPFQLYVYGDINRATRASSLKIMGRYNLDLLRLALIECEIDCILIPSIWPETYCLVFDEVVGLGLPIFYFPIGAISERGKFWDNSRPIGGMTVDAVLTSLETMRFWSS